MTTSGARHARSQGGEAMSRFETQALERSRTLHRMRGGIMLAISLVTGVEVFISVVWLVLAIMRSPAAPNVGVVVFVAAQLMNLIILFVAWMTLEALGRIERETERVQQFMDNVYRRMLSDPR